MFRTSVILSLATLTTTTAAFAQHAEPIRTPDGLVFPNDAPIPRWLTDAEREYWRQNPPATPRVTPPPGCPVRAVAEYEPTSAICISWEGGTALTNILADMAVQITDSSKGNADLYVAVDSATVRTSATSVLTARGVNMSRVFFVVRTMDSIWMRDYGPRYIYQGQCRAIVDHVYNRPRPNDDTFPSAYGTQRHHARYEIPLVHGGGNYHLDENGFSFCTRLVDNENNGGGDQFNYTEPQIHDLWEDYQGCNTHFFDPFPTAIDVTQHIDMWLIMTSATSCIISDWPNNAGSTQDIICDDAAAYMTAQGYTVFRVPAFSIGGTHYTYANAVICNNVVLVPTYTNATVQPNNAGALATWQAAMPGRTVVGINAQNIIGLAGAFHCIVMHVPAHLGGVNPTVHMTNLRGGESLTPGDSVEIKWISDDDQAVSNVDILLSTDGGATYPDTIAAATADDGAFTWTVPALATSRVKLKLVAHDAQGNTGDDHSDTTFAIGAAACIGDLDSDGTVGLADLSGLLSNFGFQACTTDMGDTNGDCTVDLSDLAAMLAAFGTVCQ